MGKTLETFKVGSTFGILAITDSNEHFIEVSNQHKKRRKRDENCKNWKEKGKTLL